MVKAFLSRFLVPKWLVVAANLFLKVLEIVLYFDAILSINYKQQNVRQFEIGIHHSMIMIYERSEFCFRVSVQLFV